MKSKPIFFLNHLTSLTSKKISYLKQHNDLGLFLNAVFIWGSNTLPALFGVAYWWLASRIYSPADIGLASGVISAATLIGMLSRLGLDVSLIRLLPETENQDSFLSSVIVFNKR